MLHTENTGKGANPGVLWLTLHSHLLAVTARRKLLCKMYLMKHMWIAHSLWGERNRYWKRRYGLKAMTEKSSMHRVTLHQFDKPTSSILIRFFRFFYSYVLSTVCSYVKSCHSDGVLSTRQKASNRLAIIARKSTENFLTIGSREKDCLGRMCSLHNRCF